MYFINIIEFVQLDPHKISNFCYLLARVNISEHSLPRTLTAVLQKHIEMSDQSEKDMEAKRDRLIKYFKVSFFSEPY